MSDTSMTGKSFPYREHDFEWKLTVDSRYYSIPKIYNMRIWIEEDDGQWKMFKFLCDKRVGKDGKELPDHQPSELRYREAGNMLEVKHPGGRWQRLRPDKRDAFLEKYHYFFTANEILLGL